MPYASRTLPHRPREELAMKEPTIYFSNGARGARPGKDSRGAPRLWLNVGQPMRPLAILSRAVRVWRILKRTRRQLAELDDRQLRDVGLTRGQALREHSKPFWKL